MRDWIRVAVLSLVLVGCATSELPDDFEFESFLQGAASSRVLSGPPIFDGLPVYEHKAGAVLVDTGAMFSVAFERDVIRTVAEGFTPLPDERREAFALELDRDAGEARTALVSLFGHDLLYDGLAYAPGGVPDLFALALGRPLAFVLGEEALSAMDATFDRDGRVCFGPAFQAPSADAFEAYRVPGYLPVLQEASIQFEGKAFAGPAQIDTGGGHFVQVQNDELYEAAQKADRPSAFLLGFDRGVTAYLMDEREFVVGDQVFEGDILVTPSSNDPGDTAEVIFYVGYELVRKYGMSVSAQSEYQSLVSFGDAVPLCVPSEE